MLEPWNLYASSEPTQAKLRIPICYNKKIHVVPLILCLRGIKHFQKSGSADVGSIVMAFTTMTTHNSVPI